ncbi:MAG TPA: hypothetical protein VE843_04010, partial [Ktedonobacteraceae bacterium]|nr:hypothetical protein [Ktedonobacteraceae bacterium]
DEIDLVEDETEMAEPELEPTPLRRVGRNHAASATDGYKATRTQPVVEPEEIEENAENEFDLADEVEDLELPDNVLDEDESEEEMIVPEADIFPDEEEMEDDDPFFDEEIDEEDEDEDSWGARGRKKPKPGRQTKAPKPTKKPKREGRRGF